MKLWHVKTRSGIIVVVCVLISWLVISSVIQSISITRRFSRQTTDRSMRLEFLKRQQRVYDTCVQNDEGAVNSVYTYPPKHVVYCPVAKVGSTFWKRVLLLLHNDTNGIAVNNPFQIPRLFVHYGPHKTTKKIPFDIHSRSTLSNMTRFLFVRDPYSRLWSAYLDKFFLPDFWWSYAREIISLRTEEQAIRTKVCNHDVTFNEFLAYVASFKDHPDGPGVLNEHWRPIQYLCNPCELRPHLVGKQETFGQDMNYVLKYFGLNEIVPTHDRQHQVEEEMKTLIDYNYKKITMKYIRDCLTKEELAMRLWTVFEFNGYLPMKSKIRLYGLQNVTKTVFTELALETYRSKPSDSVQWKKQRRVAMKSAYRNVPQTTIRGLQELFKMDFIHFSYNSNPL